MVNPLRGFISDHERLFRELDIQSNGISLYDGGGMDDLLVRVVDTILGRAIPITIGGDTVTVDRDSAEAFFERNATLFRGLVTDAMSIQERILRLLDFLQESKSKHLPGLPLGLVEGNVFGGAEARQRVIGMLHQFASVLDVLQENNFDVSLLRKRLTDQEEKKFLQFDRESFVDQIISQNWTRVSVLSASLGRPEIREFAQELIDQMHKKQSKKESEQPL